MRHTHTRFPALAWGRAISDSDIPLVVALAQRFIRAKAALGPPTEFFFQLSGERPLSTPTMSQWVSVALAKAGISASRHPPEHKRLPILTVNVLL